MSTMTQGERFVTPREAAELCAVDRRTIYRLVERGELPAVRVGAQIRIRVSDLVEALRPAGGAR